MNSEVDWQTRVTPSKNKDQSNETFLRNWMMFKNWKGKIAPNVYYSNWKEMLVNNCIETKWT